MIYSSAAKEKTNSERAYRPRSYQLSRGFQLNPYAMDLYWRCREGGEVGGEEGGMGSVSSQEEILANRQNRFRA